MRQLFLLFSTTILFGFGCSVSSVDVENKPKPHVEPQKQLFNAQDAVQLLEGAQGEEQLTQAVIEISEKHHGGFEWPVFWATLSEREIFSKRSAKEKNIILSLHHVSCTAEDFDSFVNFLLREGESARYLASREVQCRSVFKRSRLQQVISTIFIEYRTATDNKTKKKIAVELLDFVTREGKVFEENERSKVLRELKLGDWEDLTTLVAGDRDEVQVAVRFLRFTEGLAGFPNLADRFALEAVKSKEGFEAGVHYFGYTNLLTLVSLVSPDAVRAINPQALRIFRQLMIDKFNPQKGPKKDRVARWGAAWDELIMLRKVQKKFSAGSTLSEDSLWVERLHRKAEDLFLEAPEEAVSFLAAHAPNSPDSSWVSFRLRKRIGMNQGDLPNFQNWSGKVDTSIKLRLNIHFAEASKDRAEAVTAFCAFWKEERWSHLTIGQFQVNPYQVLKPGCHWVRPAGRGAVISKNDDAEDFVDETGIIEVEDFVMPFDSVLLAPGNDVSLKGRRIDGSVFDFSAHFEFEKRPLPNAPDSYNAVTFPVILGVVKDAEVNFLAFHYVYRQADSAEKWLQELEDRLALREGLSGGNLVLDFSAEDSVWPTFVAQGGLGQTWEASTAQGGKGSVSFFDYSDSIPPLVDYLTKNPVAQFRGNLPAAFSGNTVAELNALVEQAEENVYGFKKIFVLNDFHRSLSKRMRDRVIRAAETFEGNKINPNNLPKAFVQKIAGEAWKQFVENLNRYDTKARALETPDFIEEGEFSIAGAEPVLATSRGASGRDGEMHRVR